MHELEFLPDWYPQIRRGKQRLIFQGWLSGIVAIGLASYVFLAHRNVVAAEGALANLHGQMSQAQSDLAKLDELIHMQKQWRQQDEIIAKLGLHVESTRLIKALENSMPREMSLIDIGLVTEENVITPAASGLAAARADQEEKKQEKQVDRKMKIKLKGVTPTDVDLANFLGQLSSVTYFENIAMTYAKDRTDNGHTMREFELTFTMNLNAPPSN